MTTLRMTAEIDIWRTAKLMIDKHGEDAAIQAAMRADELMAAGDMDGRAVWFRIIRAIEDLQAPAPPDVARVN